MYCCNAPCIGETGTSSPLVSMGNIDIGRPMVSAARVHSRSLYCASNSLVRVDGCVSSQLVPRGCQFARCLVGLDQRMSFGSLPVPRSR